jgi:hypothetical protein
MRDLIFATPWWLLALLIGGGGFVWYTGDSRMEKPLKVAGLCIAGLGVLLALLSWLFVTDKEYCEKQTRQMVAAVDHRDWPALEKLLDPRTSLEGIYKNRDEIIDGAKKTVDALGLTSVSITGTEVKQVDTVITVDLRILSDQDATMGRPAISNWRFDWANTGNGWKLVRIEPLEGEQVSRDEVLKRLQRP